MHALGKSVKWVVVGAVLIACGGGTAKPKTPVDTTETTAEGVGVESLISGGSAGSKKAERRTNDKWSACHSSFKRGTDPVADVAKLAQGCAAITKMKAIGEVMKGTQKSADVPQQFKMHAEANHCYRIYAESTEGITDLDIIIKDSENQIAGEDSTEDSDPVLMEDGAICYSATDESTIVVSVGGGEGSYALQIWGN
jgi:hypothetical protein